MKFSQKSSSFLAVAASTALAAPNPEVLQQFLPPINNNNVIDEIRNLAEEVVKDEILHVVEHEIASGIEHIENSYHIVENYEDSNMHPMFDAQHDGRYYYNGRWHYDPNPYKPSGGGHYTDEQEKKYWDWWYNRPSSQLPVDVFKPRPKPEPVPVVHKPVFKPVFKPAPPVVDTINYDTYQSYWTNGPYNRPKQVLEKPIVEHHHQTWTPTRFFNQGQDMNAFLLMMLADNNNSENSKFDKLLPLLMMQDPNSMTGGDLWNNPLFFMSLIDEETTSSCDKKYSIADEMDADIATGNNVDVGAVADVTQQGFMANVDYQYVGCLNQVEEANKDSSKDLLLPLMMSGMFNNAGFNPVSNSMTMDPMMFLLLQKSSGSGNKWSKNLLPLLMASGNQQMEPGLLMLLLEEQACDLKYHIPEFYYDIDESSKVVMITDKSLVKTRFRDTFDDYDRCIEAADDDGHDDFMMLMLLSGMGGM